MGWPQFIFGWVLVAGLCVVAFAYGRSQWRSLNQSVGLPDEERFRARGQAWRRLSASASMFLLALMLAGALIWLEGHAQQLADLANGQRDKDDAAWTDDQRWFIRFYVIYWIVFLLILLSIVSLAAYETWSVVRQVFREQRKLQADRRAMIARQAARLRRERYGEE